MHRVGLDEGVADFPSHISKNEGIFGLLYCGGLVRIAFLFLFLALATVCPAAQDIPEFEGLVDELTSMNSEIRDSALRRLAAMEVDQAAAAIVELWERNGSWPLIRRLGKEGVRPLTKLLDSQDWETRARALAHLGDLGPIARSSAESVAKLTTNSNRHVQYRALLALGQVSPPDTLALPIVLDAISAPSPAIRTAAAEALSNLDCPGQPHSLTTFLFERLHLEPRGQTLGGPRHRLIEAVAKCGERDERVYPAFLEMALNDEDGYVRAEAIQWLGEHSPQHTDDERLIETIIAALDDRHAMQAAARALSVIGSEAVLHLNRRIFLDSTLPGNASTCRDTLSAPIRWAIHAVLRIRPYEHPDSNFSPSSTIARLGPRAVRTLLPIHSDLVIRDARRYALLQLSDRAIPTLKCMLEGSSNSDLFKALDGLGFLVQNDSSLDPAALNRFVPTLQAIPREWVRAGFRSQAKEIAQGVISAIRERASE